MTDAELKALRERWSVWPPREQPASASDIMKVLALCDALTAARAELEALRLGKADAFRETTHVIRAVAMADAAQLCDLGSVFEGGETRASFVVTKAVAEQIRALAPVPPGFQLVAVGVVQEWRDAGAEMLDYFGPQWLGGESIRKRLGAALAALEGVK